MMHASMVALSSTLPADDDLPGLRLLRRRPLMDTVLNDALHPARPLCVRNIHLLSHKRTQRCVLRCALHDGQEQRCVIVKLYSRQKKATEASHMLDSLWHRGFSAEGALCVPRLLAYVPQWNMVVQEAVAGRDLRHWLDKAEAPLVLRLCAMWLRRLHSMRGLAWQRVRPPEHELAKVQHWAETLREVQPAWHGRLDSVVTGIAQRIATKHVDTLVPIHRDFYYAHALFDGARLNVVDFDECALGDACFDVGHFWGHLLALSPPADANPLTAEARHFISAYGELNNGRVTVYAAYTCLKLMHTAWQRHTADWLNRGEVMLKIAEQLVDIAK